MIARAASPAGRMLTGFALTSLAAIGLGAATMSGHDIAASRWIMNLGGWAIGALLALGLSRATADPGRLRLLVMAGAIGVLVSFAGPGQSGVHRWVGLGPLTINVAALYLPAVIAAVARMHHTGPIVWFSVLVIAATLLAQPDASQSLAFAIAIVLATGWRKDWRKDWPKDWPKDWGGWLGAVVLAALALATLLRPDPLQPVPEVEQIVSLAWQLSPLLAVAMVAALAACAASFLLHPLHPGATRAVAAYAGLVMLAPLAGWYPVPLAGSGVSFVLGLWLGAGVLAMLPARD